MVAEVVDYTNDAGGKLSAYIDPSIYPGSPSLADLGFAPSTGNFEEVNFNESNRALGYKGREITIKATVAVPAAMGVPAIPEGARRQIPFGSVAKYVAYDPPAGWAITFKKGEVYNPRG